MKTETTVALPAHAQRNYGAWFRSRLLMPAISHAIMIVVVIFIMFPMIYALLLASQSPSEYYSFKLLPGNSLFENISFAWNRINMGRLLLNTGFVAITVAVGKIILSVLGAFGFVYFKFRGKGLLFGLILVTHMLPLPVRIVPTFSLIDTLDWTNSFRALTIPFLASATGILLFRQLYQTIPPALADAARIDGASPMQFLFYMVIPLSMTNIAALFLIEFIYMWNQYLWPLLIANADSTRMIQIGLRQLVATDAAIEWHYVMSGVLIAAVPPLLLLIALQRNLIQGIALYEDK